MMIVTIILSILHLSYSIFEGIEVELGKSLGISKSSHVSDDTLRTVLQGVRDKVKESIYFYALLKLYGLSVPQDSTAAATYFHESAALGYAEAMSAYGVCLMDGVGILRNENEAVEWFQKGVIANDMNSHWLLGRMYLEGKGIPAVKDPQIFHQEAARLIAVSAEKHIPQAEHFMGLIHEYGLGMRQDFQKAAEYYRRAADQNFIESMYNLALMYSYGRGVLQDFARAKSLFEAASRLNHAPSVYYMGIFKFYGYADNGKRNYYQAMNWFEKAAGLDDFRVNEKASKAAEETRQLLEIANEVNAATFDKYRLQADSL